MSGEIGDESLLGAVGDKPEGRDKARPEAIAVGGGRQRPGVRLHAERQRHLVPLGGRQHPADLVPPHPCRAADEFGGHEEHRRQVQGREHRVGVRGPGTFLPPATGARQRWAILMALAKMDPEVALPAARTDRSVARVHLVRSFLTAAE